jgi:hypothetical protein
VCPVWEAGAGVHMQDVVARGGKFLCLYKRPGQRAIINHFGDLIVRPSVMEVESCQIGTRCPVLHAK